MWRPHGDHPLASCLTVEARCGSRKSASTSLFVPISKRAVNRRRRGTPPSYRFIFYIGRLCRTGMGSRASAGSHERPKVMTAVDVRGNRCDRSNQICWSAGSRLIISLSETCRFFTSEPSRCAPPSARVCFAGVFRLRSRTEAEPGSAPCSGGSRRRLLAWAPAR